MNPSHVVSLELAKELKEAGWNKETEFWWVGFTKDGLFELVHNREFTQSWKGNWIKIPAPLATEILEELPDMYPMQSGADCYGEWLLYWKEEEFWNVGVFKEQKFVVGIIQDKSLPNALAKMYLYLRKEKLI